MASTQVSPGQKPGPDRRSRRARFRAERVELEQCRTSSMSSATDTTETPASAARRAARRACRAVRRATPPRRASIRAREQSPSVSRAGVLEHRAIDDHGVDLLGIGVVHDDVVDLSVDASWRAAARRPRPRRRARRSTWFQRRSGPLSSRQPPSCGGTPPRAPHAERPRRSTPAIPKRDQGRRTLFTVGLAGIEPATSSLSGMRSNRLSYSPMCEVATLATGLAPRQARIGCAALVPGGPDDRISSSITVTRMPPTRSLMRLNSTASSTLSRCRRSRGSAR